MPLGAVQPFQGGGYKPPRQAAGSPSPTYAPPSTNQRATTAAKSFRDTLGLPSFQDILGRMGGSAGTKEFGNAGAAGEGAAFAKNELGNWKKDLRGERGQLDVLRGNIKNPTKTSGFQNVMRLTNERLGQASEAAQHQAADAASRRGYVGGYSPGATEKNRMEALATAGYETAAKEREAQQAQFGNEASLYGSELGGYQSALGSYTDLTKTAAELPTKWLDSYSGLLSGLGGGFGDIFGTALKGEMYDEENRRGDRSALKSENRDKLYHRGYYGSQKGAALG